MKLRKGWKVYLSKNELVDFIIYSEQDYAETPELRKWLNNGKPLKKERVLILH